MMQPEEQLFNWSDYVIADIRADTANGSKVRTADLGAERSESQLSADCVEKQRVTFCGS